MEKFSFSMATYLPEMPFQKSKLYFKQNSYSEKLKYTFCRIVFRTPVANLKSDINGLDLYTSSVLGIDRYDIASSLYNSLSSSLKST